MEIDVIFELLTAFFACIGIVAVFWYLLGLIYRRYALGWRIFTVALRDSERREDMYAAKCALWYVDNFTTGEVYVAGDCEEPELEKYCRLLYVTRMAKTCEICDILRREN